MGTNTAYCAKTNQRRAEREKHSSSCIDRKEGEQRAQPKSPDINHKTQIESQKNRDRKTGDIPQIRANKRARQDQEATVIPPCKTREDEIILQLLQSMIMMIKKGQMIINFNHMKLLAFFI